MTAPHPTPSGSEPLVARRSQPLLAALTAGCVTAATLWLVSSGGFSGGLVDHESPPEADNRYTVNLNTATPLELSQLPGLGPTMARRIVDYRSAHGDFPSLDALLDVPGVGEATLAAIRPHLRPIRTPPTPR